MLHLYSHIHVTFRIPLIHYHFFQVCKCVKVLCKSDALGMPTNE